MMPEIANEIGYTYNDLEQEIKKHIGKTVHDIVVALKEAGFNPAINGDHVTAFIQRAKEEVLKEARAVEE
jgi:shikimate kinase